MPPIWPSCDAMLMTLPDSRSSMPGSTNLVHRKTPRRLTEITRSQSLDLELGEGLLVHDAGVVDQDVHPAELGQRGADHRPDLLLVGHVGAHQQVTPAGLLDRGQHGRGRGLAQHVRDDHVGTLGRERGRDPPADPPGPAGHDGDLAC